MEWSAEARTRLMFLILDAAPHTDTASVRRMQAAAAKAAAMTDKEKSSAVQRKRAAQSRAGKPGKDVGGGGRKPTNVATKVDEENLAEVTFKGSPCTVDCSGHEAGYEWYQRKQRNPNSWSTSFNNGAAIAAAGR
jgi:hypothetical protein